MSAKASVSELGREHEVDHRVGDAGRGVDQQVVELLLQPLHAVEQGLLVVAAEVGVFHDPGCPGHHAHAARAFHQDRLDRQRAVEEILERVPRRQAHHDVDVRQARVRIDDAHPLASQRQRHRDIGRDAGLADAALAAGDRDHARAVRCRDRLLRIAEEIGHRVLHGVPSRRNCPCIVGRHSCRQELWVGMNADRCNAGNAKGDLRPACQRGLARRRGRA